MNVGSIPFVWVFLVYESIPKGMLFLIGLNIKIIIADCKIKLNTLEK